MSQSSIVSKKVRTNDERPMNDKKNDALIMQKWWPMELHFAFLRDGPCQYTFSYA